MHRKICPLLVSLMRRAEAVGDDERAVSLLWAVCGFGPVSR